MKKTLNSSLQHAELSRQNMHTALIKTPGLIFSKTEREFLETNRIFVGNRSKHITGH